MRGSLLVVVVACSSNTARPTPTPVVVEARPVALPKPSAASKPSSGWVQEIVDTDVLGDFAVVVHATASGPALLATPGTRARAAWLTHGVNGWTDQLAANAHGLAATIDDAGTPWFVLEREGKLLVRHGAALETLVAGRSEDTAGIALDRNGVPHVCIATDRAVLYATRGAKWTTERVAAKAQGCTIAVGNDGVVIGVDEGVVARRDGSWKLDVLGGPTRVARGKDGATIAVTATKTSLVVTRNGKQTPLVDKLEGMIVKWAIAADTRVHVAYDVRDPQGRAEIRYAVEGVPSSSVADADAQMGIGLAVDANGEPHVAFATHWAREHNSTLRYARHRIASDRADLTEDLDGAISACGAMIGDELGVEPPLAEATIGRCVRLAKLLTQSDQIDARCKAKRTDACLVGAAMEGSKRGRTTIAALELLHVSCGRTHCLSAYREDSQFGQAVRRAVESDRADTLAPLRLACDQKHSGACFQIVVAEHPDDFAAFAKLCTPRLPIACARAVQLADPKAPALETIRATLEVACATSERATACDTLAYMKEGGLGGRASNREPRRHRTRACILGSGSSCTRLLGAPPPNGLDGERFAELLADRCDKHVEEACLALANAYHRGWLLVRDPDEGRTVLMKACENRVEVACKRLGLKLP